MYDNTTLKTLRRKNGLTQQQVADLLRMERSTYAYYETGRSTPSINTVIKLARMYKVNLYNFLNEQQPLADED